MEFNVYSRVDRGLEDLVIRDLAEQHNINAQSRGMLGKVFYTASLEKIIELNLSAKSINRVIILLEEANINSLEDIPKIVGSVDFVEFIEPQNTFAIRANRVGKHNFSSLEIARMAGKAVIDNYYEATGKKLKVNLDNPDIEIVVEVINDKVLVGIDTTGLSLHIRRYRVFNHPMPIKTTIGYLLVRLTDWDRKNTLVDPTCGGATIPIEAALLLKNIPICYFRRLGEFAMYRLPFIDNSLIEKKCNRLVAEIKWEARAPIFGIELNREFVKGAVENVANARVDDTVKIIEGDALRMREILGGEVQYIVSNPPYSLPDFSKIRGFYSGFIKSIDKALSYDGVATIITSEYRLVERYVNETNLRIIHRRKIPYGSLQVEILKMVKGK